MKKIKILRIIARLNIGGPAIHTVLLTKELNDDFFESVLLCGPVSKEEGDMGYIADHYGVKPVYIRSLRRKINPFFDIMALYRIMRYIKMFRPDIVHTHTAKAGMLGRLAAILSRVPVRAHTFHGNVFRGYFSKRMTSFFVWVERALARFTHAIVAISPSQKKDFVERYRITNPDKCRIIKLGFDIGQFLQKDEKGDVFRKRFTVGEDDILVGIVGRLVPIKNHRMFINAAEYAIKHADAGLRNRIKFVIVGDGECRRELEAYVKFKKLESSLFFAGWARNTKEVYAGLDIACITSINEGTPVSLIEAMAASKPVVSTDVGGVRDALGTCGIMVRSGDHRAMALEILSLARSPEERRNLGSRGREWARETYGKERLVSELRELYHALISKHKKGRGH